MHEPWLVQLEELIAESDEATAMATVASVAGREIAVDEAELRAAGRRALLVLASGGDPSRGLDLDGPAVTRLAEELDEQERREALEDGLFRLLQSATGLPHVSEAVRALLSARDVAWRAYACALLAEQLGEPD